MNMTSSSISNRSQLRHTAGHIERNSAQDIYKLLMDSPSTQAARSASRAYLTEQLEIAAKLPCDMPSDPKALEQWMEHNAFAVGERYASYLANRKAGAPRSYFSCKAHALSFLQNVAPTKLADGAWLYGTLQHWNDQRFYPLIRTYMEELGDGDPAQNHVVLYQRLLAENGCDVLPHLSDEHYTQGAIQLALGYNAERFMPEIIGYNLGYEQLPLHLLITAFELGELGIDPYYFTVHVTVDNASTGHARKAVQSVLDCLPAAGDQTSFLQRVANGYRLNELGLSTTDVIESFDLENELIEMLERKSVFARHLHSDFCSIGGRTVNEWLATPGQIKNFLQALEAKGWIKRHVNPSNSRFWKLIHGPKAQMAGVFNKYEAQLMHDWIAGDSLASTPSSTAALKDQQTNPPRKRRTFRRYKGTGATRPVAMEQSRRRRGDLDQDIKKLENELPVLPEAVRIQRLIGLMAPNKHTTASGLYATRQFARLCNDASVGA